MLNLKYGYIVYKMHGLIGPGIGPAVPLRTSCPGNEPTSNHSYIDSGSSPIAIVTSCNQELTAG